MKTFILLIMLLWCNVVFASTEHILNQYIRDDIIKFLYIEYKQIDPYYGYDIFDEINLRKYLNCFIVNHLHNEYRRLNIDNVNINIYDSFLEIKNVQVIGYVLLDGEREDVNFDITMKMNGMDSNYYKIDPYKLRYKILYVYNNLNKEYCVIR